MPGDTPKLLVVAGPNGAGKSTFVEHFQRGNPKLFPAALPVVNPDHVSLALAGGSRPMIDLRLVEVARNAVDEILRHAISRASSVGFETNFSHPSKIDLIRLAKDAGFQVVVLYVGLSSPQLAEERVERRVRAGGHDVVRGRIASRYHGGLNRLAEAVPLADVVVIYDNSGSPPKPAQTEIFRFYGAKRLTVMAPAPEYLAQWVNRHFPALKAA